MRLPLLLLPVLALAACGSDGERESACSVLDNGDGTYTIRCGDGELVVAGSGEGTTCLKSPAADGGAIVTCTDGTTIVLDADGTVVYQGAGAVQGRVTLSGVSGDHSGTTVRAIGTDHLTITDERGDFYLSGLAAGIYDLLIEREGWEPLRHRNTIAVGGILQLDPLVLRRGRKITGSGGFEEVSPAEDTLVAQQDRALWFHPVDRLAPVELSPNAVREADPLLVLPLPTYEPGGVAVVFLENMDPASLWGTVRRYDIATGAMTTLSERAMDFQPLAGGPVLIWRAAAEVRVGPVGTAEVVLRYPDGAELRLGTSMPSRGEADVGPGGRAVALYGVDGTVVLDVDARNVIHSGSGTVAAWSPDGRKAVLATPETIQGSVTLAFLDLDAGTVTEMAVGAYQDDISFSRDGSKVLFLGSFGGIEDGAGTSGLAYEGQLQVADTRTLEPIGFQDGVFFDWGFSPDGTSVLYQRAAGTLVHWDFARRRAPTAIGTASVDAVEWSVRGDRLAFAQVVRSQDGYDYSCYLVRFDVGDTPALFRHESCDDIHFLPDGVGTTVVVWSASAKRELRSWEGGESGSLLAQLPGATVDAQIEFAPGGGAVRWFDRVDGWIQLWVQDLVSGATGMLLDSVWAEFSPDGSFAVSVSGSSELVVHEVATGVTTSIDTSVVQIRGMYRNFVLYGVNEADDGWGDEATSRTGLWLSRYPRTATE